MDILENLRTITVNDATFNLPDNLEELEEILGGVGTCVSVGYSMIETLQDQGQIFYSFILFYFILYSFFFFFFFLLTLFFSKK